MSYMGLFWETGMPEAWALSRKSGDRPDVDAATRFWPRNMLDGGIIVNPANVVPGDNAGRPAPIPDDGRPKG